MAARSCDCLVLGSVAVSVVVVVVLLLLILLPLLFGVVVVVVVLWRLLWLLGRCIRVRQRKRKRPAVINILRKLTALAPNKMQSARMLAADRQHSDCEEHCEMYFYLMKIRIRCDHRPSWPRQPIPFSRPLSQFASKLAVMSAMSINGVVRALFPSNVYCFDRIILRWPMTDGIPISTGVIYAYAKFDAFPADEPS